MKYLLLSTCMMLAVPGIGQDKKSIDACQFSISNNHSSKPFSSLGRILVKDFNPGFSLGPQINLSKNQRLALELKLQYFYLQKVQHSISLSSSIGYRIGLPGDFFVYPSIGVGITQSVHAGLIMKLGANGQYDKSGDWGRTQFLFLLNERIGKKLSSKGHTMFIAWQQTVQTPFIKEYVPLLPFNSLSLGVTIPHF